MTQSNYDMINTRSNSQYEDKIPCREVINVPSIFNAIQSIVKVCAHKYFATQTLIIADSGTIDTISADISAYRGTLCNFWSPAISVQSLWSAY